MAASSCSSLGGVGTAWSGRTCSSTSPRSAANVPSNIGTATTASPTCMPSWRPPARITNNRATCSAADNAAARALRETFGSARPASATTFHPVGSKHNPVAGEMDRPSGANSRRQSPRFKLLKSLGGDSCGGGRPDRLALVATPPQPHADQHARERLGQRIDPEVHVVRHELDARDFPEDDEKSLDGREQVERPDKARQTLPPPHRTGVQQVCDEEGDDDEKIHGVPDAVVELGPKLHGRADCR